MKRKLVSFAFLILIAPLLALQAHGAPIVDLNSPMMNVYSDQTAHQIGDIISINLSDSLTQDDNHQFQTNKSATVSTPTGVGLFHFIGNLLGFSGSSVSNAQRQIQDQASLVTNFAVKVIGVEPNGNLQVAGTHEVVFDNEKRYITLTGLIRPKDVSSTDTVASSLVADMQVNVQTAGNSPGIIEKILRFLF